MLGRRDPAPSPLLMPLLALFMSIYANNSFGTVNAICFVAQGNNARDVALSMYVAEKQQRFMYANLR